MRMPEKFETDRLVLTRLRYEDADEIFYTYASKHEATKYVAWPRHINIKDTRAFLDYAVSGWNKGIDFSYGIRIRSSNRFIGSCGVMNNSGKIQFGYVLGPTYWGKGYATEVCRKLLTVLRSVPEVYRIGTFVDIDNHASSKVLLKAGLVEEAHLVNWFRFVNQNDEPKDCILYKYPM